MSEYKLGQKLYVFYKNKITLGIIVSITNYFDRSDHYLNEDQIFTRYLIRAGREEHSLNATNILYGETIEEVFDKLKKTATEGLELST